MGNTITITLELEGGKKVQATLDTADNSLKKVTQSAKSTQSKLAEIGQITTGINSAFNMFGSAVNKFDAFISKYTEFEAGLKNVNTIINVSNDELKKYGEQLLEVSQEVGQSGKDLTDAMYQAVSAGIPAGEAIKFVDISARAAVAGLSDTTTAVDGLTTVLNAFHMDASRATEISDIMFQTVKLGKTTFGELAGSLSEVAPLAAANNIEFDQISAAIATLTKQGVPTAQAITQIRASIIAANDVLGDGWAQTKTYQEGMQAIADKSKGSQNKLKELVGRIEGVNAILGVTGQNAQMAASDLDTMTNSVGAMNEAFNIQTESIEFKTKKISASLDALSISFIDSFAEPMAWLLSQIDTGIKGLGLLMGTTKIDGVGKAVATVGDYMAQLKGTTKEFREQELDLTKVQLEEIQKNLGEIIADNALIDMGVKIGTQQNTAALEANIAALKKYIDALKSYSDTPLNIAAVTTGGASKPKLDESTFNEMKFAEQEFVDEMDKFINEQADEFLNSELQRFKDLAELKKGFYFDDKLDREQDLFEKKVAQLSEIELNNVLTEEKKKNADLQKQIQDATTKDQIENLKKQKKVSDEKIDLIESERDAIKENIKQQMKSDMQSYDSNKSLLENLRDVIASKIRAYVADAVSGAVSKALASVPFPFNLVLAATAGVATSKAMEAAIPKFATGVRGFGGGFAKVGERGEELVYLPGGANVYSNGETMNILNALESMSAGRSVNVNTNINQGEVVGAINRLSSQLNNMKTVYIPVDTIADAINEMKLLNADIGR